ncbi:MAG: SpoIIE family protein phosphatase, partial [bacterium]|nr:SpoIIE family protein phosphatase [bacterium]
FTQKEFKEIKGDRFPIGGFQKKERKVFTKHELSITSPSMFYIFSDGFPDQLGGHKGHRFTNQRFYNLLEHIHRLPMDMQEENLEKNLEQWKGDQYDQIDDILLLGFKI